MSEKENIEPVWATDMADSWLSRYALLDDDLFVRVPLKILRGLRADVERYRASLALAQRKGKKRIGAIDMQELDSGNLRFVVTAATVTQEREMARDVARFVADALRPPHDSQEESGG